MLNPLKLKEAALVYLDRSGGLQRFVDDCKRYNESKQSYAVYRFNILINPSDVVELDAVLGNHILHQPLKAAQLFQSVCFVAVKTLSLIEQLKTETQINIVLKITHLPSLPSYCFDLYKQIVEIIAAKALCALQGYSDQPCRFQSLSVFLRDELSNKMKIGNKYGIIGIPICVKTCSQAAICIEANSIHLCRTRDPSDIGDNFRNLLTMTSNSCWKFTAILANFFASQIVPPGVYTTLKLCLLMSLVQTSDKDNEAANYLDILIITSDQLLVDRLLNFSVCLVPRGIRHPAGSEIFPTVSKDKYGTGAANIQACSVLLAKDGICFIGDLPSYKKDKLELLQSVLESRTITMYIPGKKCGGVDQQINIPIQTSFWSFIDLDSSSKRHVYKNSTLIGQMDFSMVPSNLMDSFGLLIHCSESSPSHPVLPCVEHCLKKAVDQESISWTASQQFTVQDFEKLIAFAKNLHVELSPEAKNTINGYYLASRRTRTDSVHGSKLTASALKHLVALSEAHAKLSLRKSVLKEDALIAILLFETSLTLKYGTSVFCTAPNAAFPFELNNAKCLQQRDVYLLQCQQQLQQFIATYGSGVLVSSNEE
ncbi:minichromosome maintenance domain-containing protein 2 isoform X3 [Tachyglossus aculeatus]|uniref:minichromosome maintenance domain-containing protein 2 isoform X3 n=1 Tax=Tachyglossus aculeatus TaxID=9261 RepID=UPI0018F49D1A|nr:minichromosome maintenance domain-containing protein 2 isoform X3 [Tachyglossus aculeatus]